MIFNWDKIKIYIKPGSTDLRKQINGLSHIVTEEMQIPLFTGDLFLFSNKNRKLLKILYWNNNGFCLWLKRLNKDRFPWPKNKNEAREIKFDQLKMFLNGIDFWNAHTKINYTEI